MIITVNEELGVVIVENDALWGMAICSEEDIFNVAAGLALAKSRMVHKDLLPLPERLKSRYVSKGDAICTLGVVESYLVGKRVLNAMKTVREGEGVAVHPAPAHLGIEMGKSAVMVEALRPMVEKAAETINHRRLLKKEALMESLKSEPAATPPAEPSAPAAPSSQSHVTLTSGEYLRLLALAKRAEAARGTEPADTRRPRDK